MFIPEEKCKQVFLPLGQEAWSMQVLRTNAFSSLLHLGLYEEVLKNPFLLLLTTHWGVCGAGCGAHRRGGGGEKLFYTLQKFHLHSSTSCMWCGAGAVDWLWCHEVSWKAILQQRGFSRFAWEHLKFNSFSLMSLLA